MTAYDGRMEGVKDKQTRCLADFETHYIMHFFQTVINDPVTSVVVTYIDCIRRPRNFTSQRIDAVVAATLFFLHCLRSGSSSHAVYGL